MREKGVRQAREGSQDVNKGCVKGFTAVGTCGSTLWISGKLCRKHLRVGSLRKRGRVVFIHLVPSLIGWGQLLRRLTPSIAGWLHTQAKEVPVYGQIGESCVLGTAAIHSLLRWGLRGYRQGNDDICYWFRPTLALSFFHLQAEFNSFNRDGMRPTKPIFLLSTFTENVCPVLNHRLISPLPKLNSSTIFSPNVISHIAFHVDITGTQKIMQLYQFLQMRKLGHGEVKWLVQDYAAG